MAHHGPKYADLTEEQKEKIRERSRQYYWTHAEERREYQRTRNPAHGREALRKSRAKLKAEVYSHYGDKCACCGETEPRFLTLDHVNGGGRAHRQSLRAAGPPGPLAVLYDIKKRGYPPDFQILCFNCNCGRQANGGVCPHKEE
jgi:hypothetical protein